MSNPIVSFNLATFSVTVSLPRSIFSHCWSPLPRALGFGAHCVSLALSNWQSWKQFHSTFNPLAILPVEIPPMFCFTWSNDRQT